MPKSAAKRGKRTKPKSAVATSALPKALAVRARGATRARLEKLKKSARVDLALIKRRKEDIVESFYDIGEALRRLRDTKGVVEVLGYTTFDAMCRAETGFAPTQVDELIGIVEHMTREEAIAMGQKTRAAAFVELAKATPADDTAGELFRKGVTSPRGKRLLPKAGSTRAIEDATKDFRAARHAGGKPRGRTTSPDERAVAEHIERGLHRAGFAEAVVRALATRPGQPCHYRLEKLSRDALVALGRLLPKH